MDSDLHPGEAQYHKPQVAGSDEEAEVSVRSDSDPPDQHETTQLGVHGSSASLHHQDSPSEMPPFIILTENDSASKDSAASNVSLTPERVPSSESDTTSLRAPRAGVLHMSDFIYVRCYSPTSPDVNHAINDLPV